MNVGRMDLAVIQYFRVRVEAPDNEAWRMQLLYSNASLGVMLLLLVGQVRNTIVPAGASRAEESG